MDTRLDINGKGRKIRKKYVNITCGTIVTITGKGVPQRTGRNWKLWNIMLEILI